MPTILVADDEEGSRLILSKLLTLAGFRVVQAPDGASALEVVRAERPDLALVDLLMPEVDGFEFAHRLRREKGPHARTPIIFISAAFLPADVLPLVKACGVDRVLARPAEFDDILAAVKEVLAAAPPQAPVAEENTFRLELMDVLSNTLSQNLRTIIPALAEYLEDHADCSDKQSEVSPTPIGPLPRDDEESGKEEEKSKEK